MATWEKYRKYVDSYLGKLSPEGLKAVRNFQSAQAGGGTRDAAEGYLQRELGLSPDDARRFASVAMNAYNFPNQEAPIGDMYENAGGILLKQPHEYESEDEYIKATMQYLNMPGFTKEDMAKEEAAKRKPIKDQIQAFVDSMLGPVESDPVYQQLNNVGRAASMSSLGRAGMVGGLRSGLGQAQVQSVTQANVLPYLQKRQELGLAGHQLASQHDLGLGQLNQGYTNMLNQQAEMYASARQAHNAATGQMAGGFAAAIPGALLAPYTNGQSLNLIPAGANAGGGTAAAMSAPPKYTQGSGGSRGTNPYTGY